MAAEVDPAPPHRLFHIRGVGRRWGSQAASLERGGAQAHGTGAFTTDARIQCRSGRTKPHHKSKTSYRNKASSLETPIQKEISANIEFGEAIRTMLKCKAEQYIEMIAP
jgi:hypothetical protein